MKKFRKEQSKQNEKMIDWFIQNLSFLSIRPINDFKNHKQILELIKKATTLDINKNNSEYFRQLQEEIFKNFYSEDNYGK